MFTGKHQRRTNLENITQRSGTTDEKALVLQAIDNYCGSVAVRVLA